MSAIFLCSCNWQEMGNFWQRPWLHLLELGKFLILNNLTSTSGIDISTLLNHSDQKLSSPQLVSGKGAQAGGHGRVSGTSEGRDSTDSVSQSDINQIVLIQLNAIEAIMKKQKFKRCPKNR